VGVAEPIHRSGSLGGGVIRHERAPSERRS
jgi:hypothetical protein